MSVKIEDPETGEEKEYFTPEEIQAKDTELATAKAEVETAKAEAEKLRRVNSEQTQNFKKLNEMTEAERASYSAKEIESMKRLEASEAKAQALETKFNDENVSRIKTIKQKALERFHGNDDELKAKLEKNYDLINLEGNDEETILERARLANAMEAGKTGRVNPLNSSYSGGAPRTQEKSKTEEFMKSEKAQEALRRMGEV